MKKKRKDRIGLYLVMTVVMLFCLTLGFHSISLRAEARELQEQESMLKEKKKDLEKEKKSIDEQRVYMQTNEYVEDVARNKFGLVYEDEVVFKAE